MHLVQDILCKYLDNFFIIFIDDILIFPWTIEKHVEHLRLVFNRLKEQKIYAKASKCQIHVRKLELLGQWVTMKGAAPMKAKLQVVCEWQTPNSVKDIQSFPGFANF